MANLPALKQDFLKSVLDYDPLTGVFRWKHRPDQPKKWNSRYAGQIAGTKAPDGYIKIQIGCSDAGQKLHYNAHVLAWLYVYGEWRPGKIDHRHGIRDDNRLSELRPADGSDNATNKAMQRNNKSGVVGVHFVAQCQKWEASIVKNGARVYRGQFHTREEAVMARASALRRIQGEFAPAAPAKRRKYVHSRDRQSHS